MGTRIVPEPTRWVLWTLVLALLATRMATADPPKIAALTPEQLQRLKQRDRYREKTNELRQQGKLAEAIAVCEKMLAIEGEVFGDVHEDVAESLKQLAEMHEQREDFRAAHVARQQVLAIRTKLHGENHWLVTDARLALGHTEIVAKLTPDQRLRLAEAKSLNQQVESLWGQGKSREAVPIERELLGIRRQVLGPEHPDTARSLNDLGDLLMAQGDYAGARRSYEEALALRRHVLGPEHPDTALSLNDLAVLLCRLGDYKGARPYLEEALAIRKKALGPEHPKTAVCLISLGELLAVQGDYAGARPVLEQALAICQKVNGLEHRDTLLCLGNLGKLLFRQGDYAGSRPYLEQVLAIQKRTLGSEHPDTAASLNNLGFLLKTQGDYAGARLYFEQALVIKKKILGPKHPDLAVTLSNLGDLHYHRGDYAGARPYFEEALAIRKKALGPERPETATSLNNMGALLHAQGDYAGARPYYEEALAIRKRLGPESPDTAQSLNNLGVLLRSQGDYAGARPYYEEALAIRKRLGPEHPDTAVSLNNLGALLYEEENYAEARRYYEKALAIREKVLGPEHPATATTLNNLGNLFFRQGDDAGAGTYYEQSLAIRKKVLGPEHPDYAQSLNNLAVLYRDQQDYARAEPLFERALEITRKNLELTSAVQSERQQLAMAQSRREMMDSYLTMGPLRLSATRAYGEILSWKGAVFSRQRQLRLARSTSNPQLARLFDELQSTASRLAALAFATPDPKKRDSWQRQIRDLTEQKERAESELSGRSADFRSAQALRQMTPARVQSALPPGTALIDLLEYRHLSRSSQARAKASNPRRLAAFVVRPDRPIMCLDLGLVEPITTAVERWRAEVMAGQTAPRASDSDPAADLRRLVWQPLERYLRGVQAVLVSPDGVLARFPFAALPGSRPGTYLIEDLAVAVIPVPQLLPQLLAEKPEGDRAGRQSPSLFLVGDVDFGATPGQPARDTFLGQVAMRGSAGLEFPRLPGTAGEIASIEAAFERVHPHAAVYALRGAEATEQAFRREARGKRYLHLATHGFFAPPELKSALERSSSEPGDGDRTIGFNPGLLSGLALAGCNRGPQTAQDNLEQGDDGILTALEVAELDLSWADLVVLSACETGLGKVAGGEGLLGLQRAFQVAGARTVVASLWKVDDEATRELMSRFYDNLWKRRLPPLEALRQAQLHILDHPSPARQVRGLGAIEPASTVEPRRRAHPRLWAAWVLSGDPGTLAEILPADRSAAAGMPMEIGGTVAALFLVLTGLSALQFRRLTRSRAG